MSFPNGDSFGPVISADGRQLAAAESVAKAADASAAGARLAETVLAAGGAEILAALVQGVALLAVAIGIALEAVERLIPPEPAAEQAPPGPASRPPAAVFFSNRLPGAT